MDPDTCLAELRRLVAKMIVDYDKRDGIEQEDANDLADRFMALDLWMAGGGFIPTAWKMGRS
jgi:hypothetical protein